MFFIEIVQTCPWGMTIKDWARVHFEDEELIPIEVNGEIFYKGVLTGILFTWSELN